ncbi:hypothetical protein QQ045_014436 [Rhodiola kirilowii]
MEPEELSNSLLCLKSFGFQSAAVPGMCLAFPELLRSGSESRNVDGMLSDLKKVNDLVRFVHNDADKWYDVLRGGSEESDGKVHECFQPVEGWKS